MRRFMGRRRNVLDRSIAGGWRLEQGGGQPVKRAGEAPTSTY
jgi:hypothetical protein